MPIFRRRGRIRGPVYGRLGQQRCPRGLGQGHSDGHGRLIGQFVFGERSSDLDRIVPGATGDVTFLDNGTPIPGTSTVALTTPPNDALQLDGTGYATLPSAVKFTSGDFTISTWFYPTTTSFFQFLFMRGYAWGDQEGDIGLKINPNSGDLDFQAQTSDGQWLFGWDAPESLLSSPFNLDQWNQVVVTRDSTTGTYTMWMNGTDVGSQVSSEDISDTNDTNPFIVGGMTTSSGVADGFQGALDEFDIFNRVLSNTEIAAMYNAGDGLYGSTSSGPTASGLVAGYHFDEGSGTSIVDYSGNGNTGLLSPTARIGPTASSARTPSLPS